MGSYAGLYFYDEYDVIQFASIFDYKFFGYIKDEEYEDCASYHYLRILKDIELSLLNESYIGTVCSFDKKEAMIFMMLYSRDYILYHEIPESINAFYGWDREIDNLPENIILQLAFD